MAFNEKVVRLSHQQLKDLSHKYESKGHDVNDSQSQPVRKSDKNKPRNKRPEREIYRPGQTGRNRKPSDSTEDAEDSRDQSLHTESSAPRPGSIPEVQGRLQDLNLNSHVSTQHDDPNSGSGTGKRRQRRPDIQIYRPRGVQHSAGDNEEFQDSDPGPTSQTRLSESPAMVRRNQAICDDGEGPRRGRDIEYHKHYEHDTRDQNGTPHTQDADESARFYKPPRQPSKNQRGNQNKGEFKKAHSLDWEDHGQRSANNEPGTDSGHVIDHGWGTDYTHEGTDHSESTESARGRRRRRERRGSGQKQWENRRGSITKSHSDATDDRKLPAKPDTTTNTGITIPSTLPAGKPPLPDQIPKVTTDEKVEQSITQGTFQGLVFTNSKKSDNVQKPQKRNVKEQSPSSTSKQGSNARSRDKKQVQDQRRNSNKNQEREITRTVSNEPQQAEIPEKKEVDVSATTDIDSQLTWGELMEAAEKQQDEKQVENVQAGKPPADIQQAVPEEHRRITAVIEERERRASGGMKKPQQQQHQKNRGGRRDSYERSDIDDVRHTEKRNQPSKDRDRRNQNRNQDRNQPVRDRGRDMEQSYSRDIPRVDHMNRDREYSADSQSRGQPRPDKKNFPDEQSKKNMQLKVTFASGNEERKVMISGGSKNAGEEKDKRHVIRPKSPNDSGRMARGGLLKLPTASLHTESTSQHHSPSARRTNSPAQHHTHHQIQRNVPPQNRGRGQSRGSSHFTLYDPKNPGKQSQLSSSPKSLQFYDPADPHQNSPPIHQMPYFQDQYYQGPPQNYYDYGYQGAATQGPFYGIPPGTQMMPHPGQPPPPHVLHQMYERCVIMRPDDYTRDLHGRSGSVYEQDSTSSHIPAGNRSRAESLLKEIQPLDGQLTNMVARGLCQDEALAKMHSLRQEISSKFEQVILLDPEACNNQNLDQLLWKCVFYQVIEMLRKNLTDGDNNLKDYLVKLLDEGITFYDKLLKSLQTTYKFSLDNFVDSHVPPPENLSRTTKLALYSAQKAMIFLGDIARYKEQVNQTANYGKARNWYMKAQQIAPKNGRPYNQLAILALYTRRKLDAVYYYMRSLAASNPFITARESLMSLFDEARKRAEGTEKKRIQELADRKMQQQQQRMSNKSHRGHRLEVWVSTDGSTLQDEIHPGDEDWDDLVKISAVELNKRFILSFLNVHGKLFTKIGMETFPEVSSQMLHEFKVLLSHTPSPIGHSRLLQLVTINMFAIENAVPKDTSVMEENCRSLHQEYAVQLALDMFGLLAERCVQLLHVHLQSGDCQILSDDLHCLFPSVKVCADWMTCHSDDWNPPPVPRDPELGPTIDVWNALASLCNMLKEVLITHVKLYPCKKEGCDPIVLPEDTTLAGFTPLLSLPQTTMYVHATVDKDISRDCLRVEKMSVFGDYLCGIEPPLLSYDVSTRQYISIAPESTVTEAQSQLNSSMGDHDVIVETESEDDRDHNTSFGSSGDESQIKALRARKVQLEREMVEKEKHQRNIRAVLDDTDHHHQIEMEVRPMMLVPDTNCFIDHLKGIQQLLATKKYTIVVPLVVINELDGLAKGSKEGQYDTLEHAEMVYTGAQRTIQYLEAQFETRHSHLRALTSKGSVLDTIAYRAEETTDEGTNDDLILSCCLHYCQDKARDYMPKSSNEPIKLHREVVLLTEDRNLRLKAHTRNVPVKDLPSFMRWAKIG